MVLLTDRHRPTSIEKLIGQQAAKDQVLAAITSRTPTPLIFEGPPGVGKTTLAQIAAQMFLCQGNHKPCGACGVCQNFERGTPDLHLIALSGARHNDGDVGRYLAQVASMAPMGNFAIFVDEVHGFGTTAADSILQEVECYRPGVLWLFATTEIEHVRLALKSRCLVVSMPGLSRGELIEVLRTACAEEGRSFDVDALKMLATEARGSARDAVMSLKATAAISSYVSVAAAAQSLQLDWFAQLRAYFAALLNGNVGAQDEALINWLAEPRRKAQRIREFLLFIHDREVLVPPVDSPDSAAFLTMDAAERRAIADQLKLRAIALGLPLTQYWTALLEHWMIDFAIVADEPALKIKSRQFHTLVNPANREIPPAANIETKPRRHAYRQRMSAKSGGRRCPISADYLTRREAEYIYDAASFLLLRHGRFFNCLLRLDHNELGNGDEKAARALLSHIAHQSRVQVARWSDGQEEFHWVYVNSMTPSGVVTDMALSLPERLKETYAAWLEARIFDRRLRHLPKGSLTKWTDGGPSARVERHWTLMRRLWAGIDPLLSFKAGGASRRLIDVLQVPTKGRGPLGKLESLSRTKASQSLLRKTQAEEANDQMPLLSAFADHAWSFIFSGWELEEARDRAAERERRQAEVTQIWAKFPKGGTIIDDAQRQVELDALTGKWKGEAHLRPRTWQCWPPPQPR